MTGVQIVPEAEVVVNEVSIIEKEPLSQPLETQNPNEPESSSSNRELNWVTYPRRRRTDFCAPSSIL